MRNPTRRFAALVLLLVIAACGSNRSAGPQVGSDADTSVRVQNQAFLDMTVYVLRGSQRVRLGMVPGASTRTFRIPSNLVFGATSLRFLADPIGSSRTPVSQEITIIPGDELQLTIPPR